MNIENSGGGRNRRKAITVVVFAVLIETAILAIPAPELIPHARMTANAAGEEQIVINRPRSVSGNLIRYVGEPGRSFGILFERARLTGASLSTLSNGGPTPPHMAEMSDIHFFMSGTPAQLKGYSAELSVKTHGPSPSAIHLQQSSGANSSPGSSVVMRADQASLVAEIEFHSPNSTPFLPATTSGIDVDPGPMIWHPRVPCGVPLQIQTEPGSVIFIDGGYGLGAPTTTLSTTDEGKTEGLSARSISVEAQQDAPGFSGSKQRLTATPWFDGQSKLWVKSIMVSPGRIVAEAGGHAVRTPTDAQSPTLFNLIRRQPVLMLLLITVNFPLALWYRRIMRAR